MEAPWESSYLILKAGHLCLALHSSDREFKNQRISCGLRPFPELALPDSKTASLQATKPRLLGAGVGLGGRVALKMGMGRAS